MTTPNTERVGGEREEAYRLRLLTTDQLRQLPPPAWQIDDITPTPGVVMTYGPPGGYKTFLVLGQSLSVATGAPWLDDHAVKQGNVVYVAAEGAHGLPDRIDAWERWHHTEVGDAVLWLPEPVNLLERRDVEAFARAIAPHQPARIVFDTLARCTVGGDENSAGDMGRAVDSLGWLSREFAATVNFVHHTGKDGGTYRGSSALLGAVDTAIEVSSNGHVTIKCEKQKDAPKFTPIELEPRQMSDSLILWPVAVNGTGLDSADALLELCCHVAATQGQPSGALLRMAGETLNMPERTFYRNVKGLVARGFVQNIGTDKRPSYKITAAGTAAVNGATATTAKQLP